MLRPEKMTRAIVVGSIESLDATIDCLYELGVLHLIDFTKQDEEFKLGQPLKGASEASQRLLKLRSMIRSLGIEEYRPPEKTSVSDIDNRIEQALVTLDLNTASKVEARQKIQALIREKESEIRALAPFTDFGVPVEEFDGYDNITSFVGTCTNDPSAALTQNITEIEIFKHVTKGSTSIAAFVKNEDKAVVAKILGEHNFQEVKLPKLKGRPKNLVSENLAQITDLKNDLSRVDEDIERIRKQFAGLIVSSEEHLAIEVLKAETPLRIATSGHSFVMDGWIPDSRVSEITTALDSLCCGLAFVETVQPEKEEETPVRLKNPKPARPFEFLLNLVSTPKYEEIDPTFVLFITFPLFFGFMVGDLGFGLCLVALGVVMLLKLKGHPDLYKLGAIIFIGGLVASLFGLFVYADAFGIPFHPPEGEYHGYSWESVVNIPIHPVIEKLTDVEEMLALSFTFGWVHLTFGFVFGFVNSYHHSLKHAFGKVAWALTLFGMFGEIMVIAGNATATSEFLNSTVLSFFSSLTIEMIGITVSLPAVFLIVVGIVGVMVLESAMALIEVTGIFTNLVSYARLAALSIGKGTVAIAFNQMLLPLVFDSGNIGISVLAAVALFVSQAFFVFFIGSLSAGIQAIRLNYVEFFLKFFEGGGTPFQPLSYERKYSMASK